METLVRPAQRKDSEQILEIYRRYVVETSISFETEVPSLADMEARITSLPSRFPWLVHERDKEILGYAYAGPFRARSAYQWSTETTAYCRLDSKGMGIGSTLYAKLLKLLVDRGFVSAYAGIAVPNSASEALHRKFGFKKVGTFRNVGFKFGKWHDVVWFEKLLQPTPETPTPFH